MQIAVNAIFLQKTSLEGYGWFVQEVFKRLVNQHPEHEFIFVFDRPYDASFVFAKNVTPVVVKPAARHIFSFKYWYDVKAPMALKKFKPAIWVQPYGFCSLTTKIPQLLVVHDLAFLHYPKFISWHQRWYYQRFTPKFLQKAKKILTVSEFSKQDILLHYPVAVNKVSVVHGAAREGFDPLDWGSKDATKASYADGREYFLFVGGVHPRKNLMNLLKAFSLFKKWQHSNMKLLVVGRLAWQYGDIVEKLKTYKYREDVVMLNYVSEQTLTQLTASAYALVYPSFFEGFGLPILEAMQSGVPVITSNTSSMPEIAGEAALFASPDDPDAIAKQLLLIYKDESAREKLIEAGKLRADSFSWDDTANKFWEAILKTAEQ
ncbi:MAG: glycosyltransferase family 1 protein [Sediminibacterium sp.]